MKKLILATFLVLIVAVPATAQVLPGDGLITLGGGFSNASVAGTGTRVDGGMVGFSYDQLMVDKPMSFVFALGYSKIDDTEDDENSEKINRAVGAVLSKSRRNTNPQCTVNAGGWSRALDSLHMDDP